MSANSKENNIHFILNRILNMLEKLTGISLTTQEQIQQLSTQRYEYSEPSSQETADVNKVEPKLDSREDRIRKALRSMRRNIKPTTTDDQLENEIIKRVTAALEEPFKNLPCPFCGGEVDSSGWMNNQGNEGPECNDCGATAQTLTIWNTRV